MPTRDPFVGAPDRRPSVPKPKPEPEVAWDRDEDEPCERGTVGCCVRHSGERDDTCTTW